MNLPMLAVLILACSSLTYTITKGKVFERFRLFVAIMSPPLGELVNCPYCTLHWVLLAGLFATLHSGSLLRVTHQGFLDFLLTWFASIYIGAMLVNLLRRSVPQDSLPVKVPTKAIVKTNEVDKKLSQRVPEELSMPSAYSIQTNVLQMNPTKQIQWFQSMWELQDIMYNACNVLSCTPYTLIEKITEKEAVLVKA